MRKFENLLIIFIVIMLLVGLWVLYLSFKIEKNELLIKILISRDGTNVELIGAIQERLERLEGRYSDFKREQRIAAVKRISSTNVLSK